MLNVLLSLLIVFLILLLSELMWNHKKLKGELGRKFVHIAVGTFVAFWPFYMSFHYIQLISLAFLIVVLAARYLKVFKAVHVVSRKTWGDLTFAIGIGLAATLAKSDWIFTAAILSMSLADGLAGIVGTHFGKGKEYKVLGHTKSVAGSVTFWLITLLLLIIVQQFGDVVIPAAALIILPIGATVLENYGVYGLDNIYVPVLITLVLGRF